MCAGCGCVAIMKHDRDRVKCFVRAALDLLRSEHLDPIGRSWGNMPHELTSFAGSVVCGFVLVRFRPVCTLAQCQNAH